MGYRTDSTFKDKAGRTICFDTDFNIVAHIDGKKIGAAQFDDHDGRPFIFSIDVDPEYRRAGIGTEIIRLAVEVHGRDFGMPSPTAQGGESWEYFTQDGAGLFNYCIDLGIIDSIADPDAWRDHDDLDD